MKSNAISRNVNLLALLFGLLFIFGTVNLAFADPQGAVIISATTENATFVPADSHTAAGGSFTTLLLNVTSQTSGWKAYIGNVTGKMTLDNAAGNTIYDWTLSTVMGEVYVSRNATVEFTNLACANIANISLEQSALNISGLSDDSINNTFRNTIHRSFVIGGTGTVANSTCFAIATYVNDTMQAPTESATFQEILMSDGRNLVYVTLLENSAQGFDFNDYDFQIIVPDNPTQVSTTYYFYAELG